MTNEQIAKEVVGRWGYEEEYWWRPIMEALKARDAEWKRKLMELVGEDETYRPAYYDKCFYDDLGGMEGECTCEYYLFGSNKAKQEIRERIDKLIKEKEL